MPFTVVSCPTNLSTAYSVFIGVYGSTFFAVKSLVALRSKELGAWSNLGVIGFVEDWIWAAQSSGMVLRTPL